MECKDIIVENNDIKLQSILSDGMVIQRGENTKIYGQASKNQKVTLSFLNEEYETYADDNGKFEVNLKALKAGGPYEMTITAKEEHKIKNILVGDVWICSGQSNMQLPVNRIFDRFEDEISSYENDNIRQFITSPDYNFKKEQEWLGQGSWKTLNSKDVMDFSGVGYFFAKYLYEATKVPIGLILTAIGGTPAEAWISKEKLARFHRFDEDIKKCSSDEYINEGKKSDANRIEAWYKKLNETDLGLDKWNKEDFDDSSWEEFDVPSKWENTKLDKVNGAVWFRKEIYVSKSMAESQAKFDLGTLIDSDTVYVNGIQVGHTDYRYPPRKYDVPKGVLKEGVNVIAWRVISNTSIGQFTLGKKYVLFNDDEVIDLKGKWKYKVGCRMDCLENMTFFEWKPTGLYNGVIYPLREYANKGVIWYQGESNCHNTDDYEDLMETLINNWREIFKNKDLPFLFVQLPFYEDEDNLKEDWAKIRDAQRKCLKVRNTGMAVAMDVGEYNDLHPLNKKDVGYRLSCLARNIAYGEDIICKSPSCSEIVRISSNRLRLDFKNIGTGLTIKGDKLRGFEVCGKDNKYITANAQLIDNHVEIYCDDLQEIKGVRYCYLRGADMVSLYNKEGFPAEGFQIKVES